MNIQDGNVGNAGDVMKHEALVALAALLRARNAGLVRHVETHTFRLVAPLAKPWTDPGGRYGALEAPWVARGLYRCSAGLVADALGPPLSLLLAEAHAETRAALAASLAEEGLPVEALVDDADALAALPAGPPAPLLVHVDPFDAPHRYWPTVEHLLRAWRLPGHDAAVLAFGWSREGPIAWPDPPGDLVPVGTRWEGRYGVAVWGTAPFARAYQTQRAG